MVHAYVGQKVMALTTDRRPFAYHYFSTYGELKEMRQPATTHKNRKKHRDHGGRAALLSSKVELMDPHDPTCGQPVEVADEKINVANHKL